ncbi:hypothetical protein ACWDRB_40125 [Nonomuraea sp. NPDC003707]
MSADLSELVAQVSPYVVAAVNTYGAAVLARANDEAADATVGWGRRILQRIFGTAESEADAPEAVRDLATDPENADLQAALRVQIGKALRVDEELVSAVQALVAQAGHQVMSAGQTQLNAVAFGQAQQAVQGQGVQTNTFNSPQ